MVLEFWDASPEQYGSQTEIYFVFSLNKSIYSEESWMTSKLLKSITELILDPDRAIKQRFLANFF